MILIPLIIGFTGSAAADLQCESGTLSGKDSGDQCRISSSVPVQDITDEEYSASNIDVVVEQGGRIYTNHKTPSNNPTAKISLEEGDFIVESGGAVHANINITAYNIKVAEGGVIDATGLGWQAPVDNSPPCEFGSYTSDQKGDLCYGGGPAGGVSGTGNSNKGSGGGGHGGKGGSFKNSNAYAHGGGYGPDNSDTYGNNGSQKGPATFGSAGGAQADTYLLSNTDGESGHGDASDWTDERGDKILNATYGNGDKDDPDSDPLDSDRWISTDVEYRKNNPNDIRMSSGGGRIKLVANNKVNVSGSLLSNGLDGFGSEGSSGYSPGGGAGGSIWIASGGIFGKGSVRADGGTYMELVDTQQDVFSGGGGGGRVYYAYSIKGDEWDWTTTANEGEGGVDLDTGWGGNSNVNLVKGETATKGTVFSRIAFSANINDSIVNPNDPIRVNGTASSLVTVTINGTVVGTVEPRASDGYYDTTVNSLHLNETDNLGNYTMSVSSTISGQSINEDFQISHRNIDIQQDSDYIMKPGEQFTVNSKLQKVKEDGSGGIQKTDYSGKIVNFDFFSGNSNLRSSTPTTNNTGGFSLSDTVPSTKGRKYYTTQDETSQGITGFNRKNLSWMNVNDTIVDPGHYIQINGTAHNTVNFEIERPDDSFLDKGSIDPNANGYFEVSKQSLTRSIIDSEEDLGNYTLRVQTELNGETRNETWEISHREVEIDNNPDFFLKPDEDLDFSDFTHLIKEDGAGGSERVDYASQELSFNYFNQSKNLNSTAVTTNNSGGYSIFHDLQPTPGLKRFTLETENQNGIDDTIKDNDIYNINNRSLAWTGINDSIVDPEDAIKVNGSAHNTVEVFLENQNNNFEKRDTLTPGKNGYFQTSIESLDINNPDNFGNYPLKLETELNGQIRTETFEVSHREINIQNTPDYLLKAGEDLSLDNQVDFYKEDPNNPDNAVNIDYIDGFTFRLLNQSNERISREIDSTGGTYSFNQNILPTPGLKQYRVKEINEKGITETVEDQDLFENEKKNIAWLDINDSIVDPGQQIQINGSAHNQVTVELERPDGSYIERGSFSPGSRGFFEEDIQVLNRTVLQDYQDLGNYTLRLNTTLNDQVRTERFELSYREVEFFHGTDYLLRPGEKFIVDGEATISRGNGIANASYNSTEYSDATDESGLDFEYRFFTGSGDVSKTPSINETGGFNISNQMRDVKGNKSYLIEHVNDNGINYLEDDNDLNNNSRERLGLVSIDDFIVNPGEKIEVEGTAYDTVSVSIGNDVKQVERNKTNGFFETEYEVPEFEDTQDFGNRTLFVNTSLNGKERSEAFNIGIRGLRFNFDQGTVKEVDPGEEFDISGNVTKFVDDGTGGVDEVSYNGTLTAKYFGEDGLIEEKTYDISENLGDGDFEITGFKSPELAGNRRLVVETTNENGITRSKKQAVRTNILLESSETVSPVKRLFKDTNLKQTRFINPDQKVTFNLQTARSLDYINNVTARVETPTGNIRTVDLNTDSFKGTEIKSSQDFQSGNLKNITTRRWGDRNTDNISLGFHNTFREDTLLDLPMENSTQPEDISPNGGEVDIVASDSDVSTVEGVFSTKGIRMTGNQEKGLSIQNSELNLGSGNEFTFMAWVKPEDKGNGEPYTIYSRSADGGDYNLEVSIGDGGSLNVNYGGDTRSPNQDVVTFGEWQHIAVTYDNDSSTNKLNFYRNGENVRTKDLEGNLPEIDAKSFIGDTGRDDIRPRKFKGSIDELVLIEDELSSRKLESVTSRTGTFNSSRIELENEVFDELKLINFEKTFNAQNISLRVLSDPNDDGNFEESSRTFDLEPSDKVLPVKDFESPTKNVKVTAELSSSNYTKSPVLSRLDLKARQSDRVKWKAEKNIDDFFDLENKLGFYNVTYLASDFSDNQEETQAEVSNFTVRDLRIKSSDEIQVSPGQEIKLEGKVEVLTRNDSGGVNVSNYTGNINAFYAGNVRGNRIIPESYRFEGLTTGSNVKIPVNGTLSPINSRSIFSGVYENVQRSIAWNVSNDWNPENRFGMLTGNVESSSKNGRSLRLGYPIRGLDNPETRHLTDYYSLDDRNFPLNNSVGSENLQKTGTPELTGEGLLSSRSVFLQQDDKISSNLLGTEDEFSVHFWVKPESVSSKQRVLSVGEKLNISILPDGKIEASLAHEGEVSKETGNAIEAGKWSNIYFEFDADTQIGLQSGKGFFTTSSITKNPVPLGDSRLTVGSEQFSGHVDELRVYDNTKGQYRLRDYSGLPPAEVSDGRPFIRTSEKEFSTDVKPGSLFLQTDAEVNNQVLNISVIDGKGNPSGDIRVNDERTIYEIPGTETMVSSKNYSLRVEMLTENASETPVLREVKLKQRGTTTDPALNLDTSSGNNSRIDGKVVGGESQETVLTGLETGLNTGEVLIGSGSTDLEVKFDEVLASEQNSKPAVNVNESGKYAVNFTVPGVSGVNDVRYYVTTENGIGGFNSTKAVSNLKITSEDVSDPVNGVEVFDYSPPNKVKFNATLAETGSVEVDRVYANITTPEGNYREVDLSKESGTLWNTTNSTSYFFDSEGVYSAEFNAISASNITELNAPEVEFNVTNATISSELSDQTVGEGRNFTVSGKLRQNLSGELHNGTVNVTIKGQDTRTVPADDGTYSVELEAPSTEDTYSIEVEGKTDEGIQALNETQIKVEDSTNLGLYPEIGIDNPLEVRGVSLSSNKVENISLVLNNTGETEARNIEVFTEDLPTTEANRILASEGATDWTSINRTYNVSAGTEKRVNATINVSQATLPRDDDTYELNVSTRFRTSGDDIKTDTQRIEVQVQENRIPAFSNDISAEIKPGFEGNLIPPNKGTAPPKSESNLTLKNIGTTGVGGIGWKLSNPRFRDWIQSYSILEYPDPGGNSPTNGSIILDGGGGNTIEFFEINSRIPDGTLAGTYSTEIVPVSNSERADLGEDTIEKSTLEVTVEDTPEWRPVIEPLRQGEVNVTEETNILESIGPSGKVAPVNVSNFDLQSNETIFNISFQNIGNRNLTFDTDSQIGISDPGIIYQNVSRVEVPGQDYSKGDTESIIEPAGDYNFSFENGNLLVGYYTKDGGLTTGQYTEYLNITCTAKGEGESCEPENVKIPITGNIQNPEPEFSNIKINGLSNSGIEEKEIRSEQDLDLVLGENQTFNVSGQVNDNEEVDSVSIQVKKHLDGDVVTETKSTEDGDFETIGFDNEFTQQFRAWKEGKGSNRNDHSFEVIIKATDNKGKQKVRSLGNITVRSDSNLDLNLEKQELTFDNVTSSSGDTVTLNGTINDTKVPVKFVDLRYDFKTGEGNPIENPDLINFTRNPTGNPIRVGDGPLVKGENLTFSYDIRVAEGLSDDFAVDLEVGYINRPTQDGGEPDVSTVDLPISTNPVLKAETESSTTVAHGDTKNIELNVSSTGNTLISGLELSSLGETGDISTSIEDPPGIITPGTTETLDVNVSVDQGTFLGDPEGEREIGIKAESAADSNFANVSVVVPADEAVTFRPRFQRTSLPIDSGNLNITDVTVENIGNQPIPALDIQNPSEGETSGEVFVGPTRPNDAEITDFDPGDTRDISVKAATDFIQSPKSINYTIGDSAAVDRINSTAKINITFQNIGFKVESINKSRDIVAGDTLSTKFNLTDDDGPIVEGEGVDIRLEVSGKSIQLEPDYNETSELWEATYQAPDIQDGISHLFKYRVSSDAFLSEISNTANVKYLDVSPPSFEKVSAESVLQDENSTIEVEISDQSNITGEAVQAIINTPNSNETLDLSPVEDERLYQADTRTWKSNFTETSQKGSYELKLNASDTNGNQGQSELEVFRVFEPLTVEGDAGEPSEQTEIRLVDRAGETAETVKPEDGNYSTTIKSGEYPEAEVEVTDDKLATLDSLEASKINQSPPRFDARINENLVNVDKEYLSGFGLVSETFENVSGRVSFDYSDQISQVDFQGNLQVMKCEDYNISKATPCQSGYETVSANNTFIDANSRTLAVEDISGFSSYILVEDESSSQDSNLNVNLTGELGNLSSLSELSDLDGLLQEVAQNTQDISGGSGSSGDTAGGGGSTGSSGSSGSGGVGSGLGDLASQLNESDEDELAIGNSKISISVQPGQEKSTAISIQNPKSEPVDIQLEATENIRDMLSYEREFNLSSGEFRTVRISVNASNKTRLKEYSGFIQIRGGETDRSIPVNIDIVGAENRLLDVSLEPTVDNFRPGKTARLKLSFSNQGFSRAVDAETTVKIVDITDDETIAKETHTYAVQTTLDKVVSLDIPKDTDLGTYEARASVEYSNIPGNRSATAVGQVEVERPFWQQQTLGLANIYWLGIILLLIAAGSGGGYWYYRKKKLEEKRKRFEEQVDNDAIPSEAGRTAFVGELSEIGTRAFINLDDLMTHCLTAGATGAGKSVAAQVMVEEALEQGVNVIVLDPTGQWSGYLDENKDDQFFAFYNDFGMKEGDARSYQGNIRAVDADQDTIDITEILRPEEEEGSIHVFSMHKLENADLEEYLSDTIQQIFDYNPEEKDQLETMIVYDEAHRVLEKFGGTGRGATMLERGAREFRKWGIGMLVISQVIEDFPEEVRANIGTQIQMRTEYEGDLDRIERKYGNNITQGVTKADTGTGMLQNSSYNHGRPYFVDFRPIKHSPERLSDEELDKFEKYNRRVDEIEDMIQIIEDQGEDVFEYESQLKLVKKNIRKRSFNLVETYLDELVEDLNDALDL